MSALSSSLPEFFPINVPCGLLSRAAAIDPGLVHRAAVVTADGKTLLTGGWNSKPDSEIVLEIVTFLKNHSVLLVAIGDPRGQFSFPVEELKHACWSVGIVPVLGSEYMTSSRCPRCWTHHRKPDRVFACPKCGFTLDRDLAGALNIYRRVFGLKSRLPKPEAAWKQ